MGSSIRGMQYENGFNSNKHMLASSFRQYHGIQSHRPIPCTILKYRWLPRLGKTTFDTLQKNRL